MSAPRTGLLGKKLGMTQIFTEQGDLRAVTAIHVGGNVVVGKRTSDKDGYTAVRLGYGEKPMRVCTKPEIGVFAKNNLNPQRFVREFRLGGADLEKYEVGKAVALDSIFQPNTYVDVVGTSKGKGFQGVLKRHHLGGSRATHGSHEFFRHGGSIGCRLTPGRVHKGKRMSGHLGDDRCTVQNLAVVGVDPEQNVLLIAGSIPGARNGYVIIRNATKKTQPVRAKGAAEAQEKSKNPMKASKAGAGAAKKPAKK